MNDRDIRREARLQQVVLFGQENAADFAPESEALVDFGKLSALLAELAAAKLAQKPVLVDKNKLRGTLNGELRRISITARKIEARFGPAGFAADYQTSEAYTDEVLGTQTRRVLALLADAPQDGPEQLAAKAARRTLFLRLEMPPGFVASLQTNAQSLAEADTRNRAGNMGAVESTARISTLLYQGSDIVDDLDTMMENKYGRDPAKLHAWERASRVESNPRRKSARQAAAPTATPEPALAATT